MINRFPILLLTASAGMTLSWFHAWNSFIVFYLAESPIPVGLAALVMGMAAVITVLSGFQSIRLIYILLLHMAGLLFSLSLLVYMCNDFSGSFLSLGWMLKLLYIEKSPVDWISIFHLLLCGLFLWIYGIRIIYKPVDNRVTGGRVDIGLAAFFLLLLIKLIIIHKGGTIIYDHSLTLSFITFIVFALFSMGLVHNSKADPGGEVRYYSSIWAMLSFIFFVLLFGGGMVMLFLPELVSGAEYGYELLKTGSRPLGNVLVFMLRFIFVKGCRRSSTENPNSGSGTNEPLFTGETGGSGVIETILSGILICSAAFLFAILIGMLARPFLKWCISRINSLIRLLFSRSAGQNIEGGFFDIFMRIIYISRALICFLRRKITGAARDSKGSQYYYMRLLRWGSRSGVPRLSRETPREYGFRLARRFPFFIKEIDLIVEMHNCYLYGGVFPVRKKLVTAGCALKKMRSPLFWFKRIKVKLLESAMD